MSAEEIVIQSAVKFAEKILTRLFEVQAPNYNLTHHLKWVAGWSSRMDAPGYPHSFEIADKTVPLHVNAIPRKYRRQSDAKPFTEDHFLQPTNHVVLLGDPGAGKTTTMRRLANRLLTAGPVGEADIFNVPCVIRLKTLESRSLYEMIASIFELPITDAVDVSKLPVGSESLDKGSMTKRNLLRRNVRGVSVVDAIGQVLDEVGCLVLLDGFDEVLQKDKTDLRKEIVDLAFRLQCAKIVVTMRAGEHEASGVFNGFDVLQIAPLSLEEASAIIDRWLPAGQGEAFRRQLRDAPYRDIVDRPLFLVQLIVIFALTGELPEQPFNVYRRIVRLMIKEWDERSDIVRESKYAKLDPERKEDFLAHFAYLLTTEQAANGFTDSVIVNAYAKLHKRYRLPANEGVSVAREIETHHGIIVQSGPGRFDFAHFSIQEYLAAKHLVTDNFSELIPKYVMEAPGVLAVCVALSGNSSAWFAGLFLKQKRHAVWTPQLLALFLRRIVLENPVFAPTLSLGLALLWITATHYRRGFKTIDDVIETLLRNGEVRESVSDACRWYNVAADAGRMSLRLKPGYVSEYGFEAPSTLVFDIGTWEVIADRLDRLIA